MKTYYIAIEQTGSATAIVRAENEDEAKEKAQKLMDNGLLESVIDDAGTWDSEEIIAVGEEDELTQAGRESADTNDERLAELAE